MVSFTRTVIFFLLQHVFHIKVKRNVKANTIQAKTTINDCTQSSSDWLQWRIHFEWWQIIKWNNENKVNLRRCTLKSIRADEVVQLWVQISLQPLLSITPKPIFSISIWESIVNGMHNAFKWICNASIIILTLCISTHHHSLRLGKVSSRHTLAPWLNLYAKNVLF